MILYYLTLVLIPFYQHPLLSYNVSGITPIKALGGAAFLWAITTKAGSSKHTVIRARSTRYLFLMIVFLCLSMAVNMSTINRDAILRLISILIFAITILLLVDTREKLLWSCIIILAGMDVASAYMVRQFGQYSSPYSGFRPGGIFGDPNYYAASALAALPVAYFLWRNSTNKLLSRFCMVSVMALGLGLLLSQSRGAWVGFAAILLIYLYKSHTRMRVVAIMCCIAILIESFSPISITERFFSEGTGVEASNRARMAALQSGLGMIRERPIFGFGLGSYKINASRYNDLGVGQIAHNSYLEIAAENGIPVLIIFLLFCIFGLKDISAAINIHQDDPIIKSILIGIRVGILGFFVAAIFLSAEYERIFWAFYFLAMASLKLEPSTVASEWDQEVSHDLQSQPSVEVVS